MKFERIGDLVGHVTQCQPTKLGRESITYLDISSVDRETKRLVAPERIAVGLAPSRARQQVYGDDVLISTVRPNLNAVAVVPRQFDGEVASTGFCVLRPFKDRVYPQYLFYFAQTNRFVSHLTRISTGASYPAVTDNDVLETRIPLPSLSEQRCIAGQLEQADRLRRTRRYAVELSDTTLPAAFLQLFGDPATNPIGFPMETVGGMFSKQRAGAKCGPFGSALKNHEYVPQGIPVWTMENVGQNEFREEGCLHITPAKFEELKAYDARNGDILISRAGTVGRMAIVETKHPRSIIHTNMIRLSLDSSRCLPVYFTVLMTFFAARVGRLKSGQEDAYTFMNTGRLADLRIPVPPLPLQQQFASLVARHERLARYSGRRCARPSTSSSPSYTGRLAGSRSMRKREALVCQHLENISRKALEEHQEIIRAYIRGRQRRSKASGVLSCANHESKTRGRAP